MLDLIDTAVKSSAVNHRRPRFSVCHVTLSQRPSLPVFFTLQAPKVPSLQALFPLIDRTDLLPRSDTVSFWTL